MFTSKTLIAGLVGSIAAFILGYLTWGTLLMDYMAGEATTNVARGDNMLWWAMIVGHLIWGFGFAYLLNNWANASDWMSGAKAGATIGLIVGGADNFINYGANDIMSMSGTLVNIIAMIIVSAIVGAIIGIMLGMGNKEA